MTQLMNKRKAVILSLVVTGLFFLIHLFLLILFWQCRVTPMFYFNIFSLIFYASMFLMVRKEHFRFFVILVYLEVVAHMSAAVYFTGWNSGFQVTLIGINFLVFYAYYVAKCLNIKAWNPVCTSLIGMSAYLIMCIVIYYHAPAYHLPEPVEFLLSIFWGANVFAITIFFLYTYTKLTSDSRELLTEEAGHDQLTGLANRYYMADYMRGIEEKYGLGGYWVAIADIDDFKKINDTCGHNCGDQVLVEMARLMSDFVKLYLSECEICRWGGEEFLLVGKGDEEKLDVEKLDSLRKMISRHDFRYENRHLDLTVTMGFAMFEGLSFKDGMELADKRLYTGKKSGKNKVVYG